MFKKIKNRFLLFVKEIGNILTNLLIPFVGLLIAILEILPVPRKYIGYLKTVEYWLFYAAGTADKINKNIKDKFQDE